MIRCVNNVVYGFGWLRFKENINKLTWYTIAKNIFIPNNNLTIYGLLFLPSGPTIYGEWSIDQAGNLNVYFTEDYTITQTIYLLDMIYFKK